MIDRYQKPLISYAVRILGNLDDAREVVQDTFLRLWQADRSKVADHVAPWLFTTCRNRAIDGIRKERKMKPVEGLADRPNGRPGPEEMAQRAEQQNRIHDLLEKLPEKNKRVLLLKFQRGLSYKEIASETGLTVSNVGFLIHTGILALRAELGS